MTRATARLTANFSSSEIDRSNHGIWSKCCCAITYATKRNHLSCYCARHVRGEKKYDGGYFFRSRQTPEWRGLDCLLINALRGIFRSVVRFSRREYNGIHAHSMLTYFTRKALGE